MVTAQRSQLFAEKTSDAYTRDPYEFVGQIFVRGAKPNLSKFLFQGRRSDVVRRSGALALAEFGGLGTEGGGRRHLGNDGQATQFHQTPRATNTKCEQKHVFCLFFLFIVFEGRKK